MILEVAGCLGGVEANRGGVLLPAAGDATTGQRNAAIYSTVRNFAGRNLPSPTGRRSRRPQAIPSPLPLKAWGNWYC